MYHMTNGQLLHCAKRIRQLPTRCVRSTWNTCRGLPRDCSFPFWALHCRTIFFARPLMMKTQRASSFDCSPFSSHHTGSTTAWRLKCSPCVRNALGRAEVCVFCTAQVYPSRSRRASPCHLQTTLPLMSCSAASKDCSHMSC